jgi:ferredoxin-nitrite reductase
VLSEVATCPGLFYATPAQDGILSRIRIPGGILDRKQCDAIAYIAEEFGGGYVDVTNRANLQIREINTEINSQVLQLLQNIGLGSANSSVDHIRNMMTSPTAGIDPQELIDTRPFVKAWDDYIATHPHFGKLSAKFSVCFDGGGKIRVCDRPNDIAFVATVINDSVYFRLYLSVGSKGETPIDVGILVQPEECLLVLAALTEVYLQHADITRIVDQTIIPSLLCASAPLRDLKLPENNYKRDRKPRLREIITIIGIEGYLREVESLILTRSHAENVFPAIRSDSILLKSEYGVTTFPPETSTVYTKTDILELPYPNPPLAKGRELDSSFPPCKGGIKRGNFKYQHIGIHPQRQPNLFYIGVVLPLGRLQTQQLRGLAALATAYGSGTIRLTPWQNLLITDIPHQLLPEVENEIAQLGLDDSTNNIKSAMVACSGTTGCKSSATDTKTHALSLAKHINEKYLNIDIPINIHFTGCEKSCAQHGKSDITLLGVKIVSEKGTSEAYRVYVGDGGEKFGRELYQQVNVDELPDTIEQILRIYKMYRQNNRESFGEFANRYAIAQLQQFFSF